MAPRSRGHLQLRRRCGCVSFAANAKQRVRAMATGLWDIQERFTGERLLRCAADLAVELTPVDMSARVLRTPWLSGRLLMHEVQPGLIVTASDVLHLEGGAAQLHAGPALSCSILLAGEPEQMRIDQHAVVAKCLERPVLIGHAGQVHVERPEVVRAHRSCDAGFMLKPAFFERFGAQLAEDNLAALCAFADTDYRTTTLARSPRLLDIARQILECPYDGSLGRLFLESSALALVAEVAALLTQEHHQVPRIGKRRYEQAMLARAILDARIAAPPSTLALARLVGVNVTTLQINFKYVHGTTVFGYVREQRLLMARSLLQQGDMAAAEIGRRVGFSNPAAFATAYKRRFGHPPMAARRRPPAPQ
ncbi:AraC family transcriptional regulator [Xanthomonas sp. PPL139]|uniref:helix-turn-helix transcriptional regulator n=1 Tax=unclassified Xanthomonas TaxID=2643310 RepID=UPI0033AAADE2